MDYHSTRIHLILATLFLLARTPLHAQWKSWKEAQLRGKVRSIDITYIPIDVNQPTLPKHRATDTPSTEYHSLKYTFNRKGKVTSLIERNSEQDKNLETRFEWNKKGQVTQEQRYVKGEIKEYTNYHYNTFGEITQISRKAQDGEVIDLIYHLRIPYQEVPTFKSHNYIWQYAYDEHRKCKEEFCYHNNGTLAYRNYLYYEQTLLLRVVNFDAEGKLASTRSFRYNEQQRLSKEYYFSDHCFRIRTFQYNEHGDLILQTTEQTHYLAKQLELALANPNKSRSHLFWQKLQADRAKNKLTESFVYHYDKQGNWTQQMLFINQKPCFLQKRILSYW